MCEIGRPPGFPSVRSGDREAGQLLHLAANQTDDAERDGNGGHCDSNSSGVRQEAADSGSECSHFLNLQKVGWLVGTTKYGAIWF